MEKDKNKIKEQKKLNTRPSLTDQTQLCKHTSTTILDQISQEQVDDNEHTLAVD